MSRLGADPNVSFEFMADGCSTLFMDVCRSSVTCRKSWRQKAKRRSTVRFFLCWHMRQPKTIVFICYRFVVDVVIWGFEEQRLHQLQQEREEVTRLSEENFNEALRCCHTVAQVKDDISTVRGPDWPMMILRFGMIWYLQEASKDASEAATLEVDFFLGCAQSWRHAKGFRPHNSLPLVNKDNSN